MREKEFVSVCVWREAIIFNCIRIESEKGRTATEKEGTEIDGQRDNRRDKDTRRERKKKGKKQRGR